MAESVEFTWGLGASILGNAYVLAAALGIVGLTVRELRRRRLAGGGLRVDPDLRDLAHSP